MEQIALTAVFVFVLFLLLGSGVWVGLALMAVAYVGLDVFTRGIPGDRMLTTIWTIRKASPNRTKTAPIAATIR